MSLGDRKKKTERDLNSANKGEAEDISYSVGLLPTNKVDMQVPNSKHTDKNGDAQSN